MTVTPVTTAICANCGATLKGDFCHECGQRAKEPRRIVIGLVQDVIVETMAVDGKLARTIYNLFLRPGRLAQYYITGKRVRFTPPFRLYLFTSVIFFFVAFYWISQATGLDAPPEPENPIPAEAPVEGTQVEPFPDGLDPFPSDETRIDLGDPPPVIEVAPEEFEPDVELGEKEDGFRIIDSEADIEEAPDWLKPIILRMNYAGERLAEDPRLFFAQAQENVPRVLLLAPIAYGMMLVLLYFYRRKFLIYDHLIVSLYMHAALYAYMLLIFTLSFIPVVGNIAIVVVFLWGVLQPFAVLRQAYGSNWFSVVIKGLIVHLSYVFVLGFLISAGLGLALYNS